tara:strand:+ start:25427 stop:25657 length:231 start_codon:yes stop_codon:yes gene_type:complete
MNTNNREEFETALETITEVLVVNRLMSYDNAILEKLREIGKDDYEKIKCLRYQVDELRDKVISLGNKKGTKEGLRV